MAPSRVARSTSRRYTPLSPPKVPAPVASSTAPAGRPSTRSQSRDVSLPGEEFSVLLKSPSRRGKESRGEKVPGAVLDTVVENAELEYPELHPSDAVDATVGVNEDDFDASSSAHSDITSNTQYELSKLDQESMINALPFLYQYSDSLLSVFSSEDAAQLERLHHDLQEPTSRAFKRLNTLLAGFMLNRKHYGDDSAIDCEIGVRALAGVRQADDLSDELWRPGAVLSMANLAWYISTMYASNAEKENARELLFSMFNSFPGLFLRPRPLGYRLPNLDLSVSFVLELRTQHLLQELSEMQKHPAFDPDETLRAIFYIDHDQLRGLDYHDEFRALPSAFEATFTKRITAIRKHFSNDVSNSVNLDALRETFPYTGFLISLAQWGQMMGREHKNEIAEFGGIGQIQSLLLDELERSQSDGRNDLQQSGQSRLAEGKGDEPRSNGSTKPSKVASPRASSNVAELPTGSEPSKVQSSSDTKGKSINRRSLEWRAQQQQKMQELAAKIQARKEAEAANNAPAILTLAVEAPADNIQHGGDDEPVLPSPKRTQGVPALSQEGRTVLAILRKQATQSNKENIDISRGPKKKSFIDKQAGAQRVPFDSDEELAAGPEKSSGKRKAVEVDGDDEDDEDDGFEVDTRPTQPVAHRRIKENPRRSNVPTREQRPSGPPSKRARLGPGRRNATNEDADDNVEVEEEDGDSDNASVDSRPRMQEATRNRHRSASSIPSTQRLPLHERDNDQPSSSAPAPGTAAELPIATQVSHVNREAKQNVARHIGRRRQTQQRSRWTEKEVARLVELIEDYGVSWVHLLSLDEAHPDGALLYERDQVGLKDKARNMKMDFLKAGVELPKNFEHIALGPRLIGILESRGVRHNEGRRRGI